jgi:hypothetical protein
MKKRYQVHDDLGYFQAYKTRIRAMQAIKNIGPAIGTGIWKIIDRLDNSVSYVKLDQEGRERKCRQ